MRRVKILPRLASVAAFLCLMFAHLLWPAMIGHSMKCDSAVSSEPGRSRSEWYERLRSAPRTRSAHRRCKSQALLRLRNLLLRNCASLQRTAVVDLEHALLDRQRQRKQFGEPVADPGRIAQRARAEKCSGPARLIISSRRPASGAKCSGSSSRRLGRQMRHLRDDEPVVADVARLHLKPRAALGLQMQDAELRHVPRHDARLRSDRARSRRLRPRRADCRRFAAPLPRRA